MSDPVRDESVAEPFRILFVCTGNTCRSPMAEALARGRARERGWSHVEVRSAGTLAHDGMPAMAEAVAVAREHGLDLESHRSAELTPELAEWADIVLTMTESHLAVARQLGLGDRAELLGEFAHPSAGGGVPDPIGMGVDAYRDTFGALDRLITAAFDRLEPILSP